MTFPRQRRSTLIYMTVLVGFTLMTALCTGYLIGRRTGTRPRTWKKRTSRLALGRLTASLVVLVVARRIQRALFTQQALPAAAGFWGLMTGYMTSARLQALRGRPPRRRSRIW